MSDDTDDDDTIFQAVRFANIYASTVYPLVSAWEFGSSPLPSPLSHQSRLELPLLRYYPG